MKKERKRRKNRKGKQKEIIYNTEYIGAYARISGSNNGKKVMIIPIVQI